MAFFLTVDAHAGPGSFPTDGATLSIGFAWGETTEDCQELDGLSVEGGDADCTVEIDVGRLSGSFACQDLEDAGAVVSLSGDWECSDQPY